MRVERWWYAARLRVRSLFRWREVERDLRDEIRAHIETQTAANVAAGMNPAEARRVALVAFGGVERIKDESRDVRRLSIVDGIAQFRHSARSLRRARVFTVATVATIALSIGAGCTVFTLLSTVLLRALPYPDSDRLVGLWHSFPGIQMPLVPQAPGTYASYRASAKSFEAIGAYAGGMATITHDEASAEPYRVPAAGVAGAIFSMLRTRPLIGRVLTDADERVGAPPVAVISEAYWRTRMNATPTVLGSQLRVDGTNREIVGVLPSSFTFPGSDVCVWMPINMNPGPYLGTFSVRAIGRLRPGVTAEAAQAELQSILMGLPAVYPEVNPGMSTAQGLAKTKASAVVRPLRDDAIGGFESVIALVAAIVGLLVVVAISNVSSLVLARTESRQREFAVRRTLGASTRRVWSSLMTEAIILSAAGGIVGLIIAVAGLQALANTGPTNFPDPRFPNGGVAILPRLDEVHPDGMLALSVLALTVLFCVLIGAISTWRATSSDAAPLLRGAGRSTTSGPASQRMRALFVVVEVALSLVLLSGSAVLGRSVLRMLEVQPGFNPTNVITFWTSPPRSHYRGSEPVARFYREALDRIAQLSGVVSVGIVSKPPLQFAPTHRIVWIEGAPRTDALPPDFAIAEASDGYFSAMGIPLIAGRVFDRASVLRGDNEAVVSREFVVRNWGDSTGARAVGRRFRPVGNIGPWYTIVGVAGDVRDTALTAPATAELYLPEEPGLDSITRQRTVRDMAFVVRTRGSLREIPQALRRVIHAVDPSVPVYDLAPMSETMAKARGRTTFLLSLLAIGSAATLALGVVGLYGVIAYVISGRAREIGIRIALGLGPADAARMIFAQGEGIIIVGGLIGTLVFLAFAKLLRSLAFEVSVVDVSAVAAAAAIVVVVASLAVWIPARRAALIDPSLALRNE